MSAFRSPAAADHVLACLRRVTPGPASQRRRSDVLDDVLQAYGDLDVDEICRVVTTYAREHGAELRDILARREGDYRRPPLLDDPAIFCVLERLEHDRYALRRSWLPAHDPAELRRIAEIWGVRLGF